MHVRPIARSSRSASEIGLGTWGLGAGTYGNVAHERFVATVKSALEHDVCTFDVSPIWGESESVVGKEIRERRADCTIVTRGGARWQGDSLHTSVDRVFLEADLRGSLERLDVEAIDVWLLNHPSESELEREDVRAFLEAAKDAGHFREWGVSTSSPSVARKALSLGARAVCGPYNMFDPAFLDAISADIATTGAAFFARSVLEYGLLAGTWNHDHTFAVGDHRVRRWDPAQLSHRIHATTVLSYLAREPVASLAEASIRWALANPLVTSALVGARSPAQIREATAASSEPPYLAEEDLVKIPQLLAALGV